MSQNPVGWFEIYVTDMERAKSFYTQLFGFELEKLDMPIEMWALPCEMSQYGATGALVKMEGIEPGGVSSVVYFTCDDCAVQEKLASEQGGEVFRSKFSIGEHGYIAIVKDTEGNMIGLHSMQ